MSTLFGLGQVVLKIFDTDGTTVIKTLYLPEPEKGGLELLWQDLGIDKKRIDGTQTRVYRDSNKRYIPKLTVKYKYYDDLVGNTTSPVGDSDGQTPTVEQLAQILSMYGTGRIAVAPSTTAPFFRCISTKALNLKPVENIVYQDITLEFTGMEAFPSMDLAGIPSPGDIIIPGTPHYLKSLNVISPLRKLGTDTDPIVDIPRATSLVDGYLNKTDFATFNAKQNALGFTPANIAGATFTGTVSAPSFDAATLNLGTSTASTINIGTASTTQTINIGTGAGTTTINLGGAGDTVAIAGTLATINTTNIAVSDKQITLNKNGVASSGSATGFEIEENASVTGYFRTTGDRTGFEMKAPGATGILTFSPGSSNASVVLSTDSRLTNSRPASDVYLWAKAATKPSYAFNEITSGAITATTGTFSGGSITLQGATYPAIGFYASGTADTRLLFRSGNNLLWRYDGTNDASVWTSATFAPSSKADVAQTMYIGTTAVAINRASAALNLTLGGSISATTGTFSSGLSTPGASNGWGVTPTIGYKTIMGTSSSATWLAYGTSNDTFRGGIQLLDTGTDIRLYANTNYMTLNATGVNHNGTYLAKTDQTMYIGTTAVAINRGSAALTLAGITLTTPNIGVATGTSFNSITGLATVAPLIDGTAAVGTSTLTARQDHRHPTDTTRQAALNGTGLVRMAGTTVSYENTTYISTSNANTYTKAQTVAQVTLTYASTVTIDASLSNNFVITQAGSMVLGNPTNLVAGQTLNIVIKQNGTGGYGTVSWGSLFDFQGGILPNTSIAANAVDLLSCYYDGSKLLCNLMKGIA